MHQNNYSNMDKPIGSKLQMLARKIKYIADDNLMKQNITLEQVKILRYVHFECNNEVVYQKEIELRFDIKRSSVTNILQNMERGQLIIRTGDTKDARIKKVQLTEKGVEYAQYLKDFIVDLEKQIVRGMTEEEQQVFSSLLDRGIENIEHMMNPDIK